VEKHAKAEEMTIFYEFQESQNNDDFWVLEILFSEICI
jgi:hypothetical protein